MLSSPPRRLARLTRYRQASRGWKLPAKAPSSWSSTGPERPSEQSRKTSPSSTASGPSMSTSISTSGPRLRVITFLGTETLACSEVRWLRRTSSQTRL